MKICDVTQFYSPVGGGVRRYITEKRLYIQNNTEDEHVLIIPGKKTETKREGQLITCTIASPPINKTSRYRILLNLRQAGDFLRQEKPDVIESGDPYHLAWHTLAVAEEINVPVCGFYHSHFPEAYLRTALKYFGPWVRDTGMSYAQEYIVRLYNRFDQTLVPSAFLVDLLKSWGVHNATHFRLGINTDVFYPAASQKRKALQIPEDRFVLLYIGRLAGEKNTQTLLETFKILHERHPDRFAFVVIGDGQLQSLLQETQKKIPLFRWISYCNDSHELADYYRMANLFVHPGVCETFGLVSLESQACGCPVVGIRGSYMDANIFSRLDLWASQNTPTALADAIEAFQQHDCPNIGLEASQTVRNQFAWTHVFKELWRNYQNMIDHRSVRRL